MLGPAEKQPERHAAICTYNISIYYLAIAEQEDLMFDHFDVRDYGAVGDGSDESSEIQDAVDAAGVHGGIVLFPCDNQERWGIGTTINIVSIHPVFVISWMGAPQRYDGTAASFIQPKPGGDLSNGIFRWQAPGGEGRAAAGGGGCIGLSFIDPALRAVDPEAQPEDNAVDIGSAINFTDCPFGLIDRCAFHYLKGRAILTDFAVGAKITRCVARYCGDAREDGQATVYYPTIQIGVDTADQAYVSEHVFLSLLTLEANFGAPYVEVLYRQDSVSIETVKFEATEDGDTQQIYVKASGGDFQLRGCQFNQNPGSAHLVHLTETATEPRLSDLLFATSGPSVATLKVEGLALQLSNSKFRGATSQTGTQVSVPNGYCQLSNVKLGNGGNMVLGERATVVGCEFSGLNISTGYCLVVGARSRVEACSFIAPATGAGGLELAGVDAIAVGNTFHTITGTGIAGTGGSGTIVANEFISVSTAVSPGTSSIVRHNKGYTTETNGTATVASGSTSVNVTHSLNRTPALRDIMVTPTNNLGNATKFWITNPTATQFTINVDVNPGASGATFAWSAAIL
jgi:hypothetical protein